MWFPSWLRKRTVSPSRRSAKRFRPTLEVLEDRAVPATLTVNTTLDVLGHANGMLSLRQAIIDTNASPGADTIVVPAGAYTLTRAGTAEDGGLTGDLEIKDSLTISGAGAGVTVIDGGGIDRVFQIDSGTVTLSGMTIQDGKVPLYDTTNSGGGIYNSGTLKVLDAVVSGNQAGYFGGGIFNVGTLTVSGSTISGNSAQYGGGIGNGDSGKQGSTVTVSNTTLSNNSAFSGGGFGASAGWVVFSESTLSGNTARGSGGGIYQISPWSRLTVDHSTLFGNSITHSTRAINYGGGGIYTGSGVNLTVSNSILSENSAGHDDGGGIYSFGGGLTVANSVFSDNTAFRGGGIFNQGGPATVSRSTLSANTATDSGGGIANLGGLTDFFRDTLTGNSAGNDGGAIWNGAGPLVVNLSTLSGNSAASGGAIYNVGTSAKLEVEYSTLSNNTATVYGGGIANFGTLTGYASTLLGNSAPLGGDLYNAGTVSLLNSIIGDRYDV